MIIENENKNNLNNFSSHLIFLYSFVVHSVQGKALISGSDVLSEPDIKDSDNTFV